MGEEVGCELSEGLLSVDELVEFSLSVLVIFAPQCSQNDTPSDMLSPQFEQSIFDSLLPPQAHKEKTIIIDKVIAKILFILFPHYRRTGVLVKSARNWVILFRINSLCSSFARKYA